MQHAKRMLVAGLAALGCATASAAQEAPRVDPTELPLSEGRRALAAREYDAASGHFLRALEHAPDDPEILALLIEASVGDDDARALWSHALWARLVDERGRARPTREQRELFDEEDASIEELGAARAAAVRELNDLMENRERLARRSPEQRLVLAWARALAWQLAAPAPALRADSPPLLELPDDLALGVIDDLRRAAETALARRSPEEAVRYAAILRGLGAQARFNDLIGEAPRGSAQLEAEGQGLLDRARGTLGPRLEEPWTLDELEYLTEEEGEAFTRDHDSLERPGRSISPTGLYRIETPCGYETLVGVTRTVEDHHRRLVNFFGRDPFEGVPGLVRVLPEANGLEREGTPFWWAGGFQRGDETVLRFSTGTIEGFGHGLTHELTHRFDGAIYPGMPAWLVEGKAVWTGAAFGNSWDAEFIPDHANFGTIEAAFIDGYGGGRKLRELIEGSIADYRDNYTAGYALYVYLSTWEEDGRALFAEPLVRYMQSAANDRREPIARFEAHFADGQAGRPRDFEAFSEAFGEFVRGFYWQDRADWTSRYTRETGAVGSGYVYDDPTWVWTRERSEPVFGLDHAREAGLLFSELGLREQAVRALLWSLSIDGLDPRVQLALEAQLEDEDARWALERLRRGLYTSAQTAAPFPRELEATMAYAEALRASA